MANPCIEIWLPDGRWQAVAEDVSDGDQRTAVMREVLKGSGLAAHMAGVNPYTLSDVELDAVTAVNALLILLLALTPGVRRYYARHLPN
jgi:hypothetical protein